MAKKLINIVLCAVLACMLVPAVGQASTYSESSDTVYANAGSNVLLACGGTLTIDFSDEFGYTDPAWYNATVSSGSEYATIATGANDYCITATGFAAGTATVTVSYAYDDETAESESFQFTITVFSLAMFASANAYQAQDPQYSSWVWGGYYYGDTQPWTAKIKVAGLPADAVLDISDKHEYGDNTDIASHGAGYVTVSVDGKGKHAITIYTNYGVNIAVTVNCKVVKLKAITTIKRTGSIVTKPKQKTSLTLKANSTDISADATWKSTNTKIAKVTSKGVVKAKGKGHCYIKAKYKGATVKIYVEVTSAKAYAAVQNAWEDYKTKIYYSQTKRNSKGYRDCSSFTRRCYYSNSPYRRVAVFGDTSWPLNAAGQASYLNSRGKCVAKKAVKISKVRPGDTVYYATGYAGVNTEYRSIDHADIYVGNGYCLGTSRFHTYADDKGKSSKFDKYHIGYSYYSPTSPSVKFIGRLCP